MPIRKSKARILFEVLNALLLFAFCFSCIYPFYYVLVYSLSSRSGATQAGLLFIPRDFTLTTYKEIFRIGGVEQAAFVSVARTVTGTALTVFCTSLFAYLLTQRKLRFRKAIYRFMVVSLYINAGLIPTLLLYKALGLLNTFLVYVIPGAVAAFNVVLAKVYIEQIPPSLEESALMDGAGPFAVYRNVILPVSLPILATIAIFTAVTQWNSWFDNFLFAKPIHLRTLQYLLYLFTKDNEAQQLLAAATSPTGVRGPELAQVELNPKSIRMAVTMIVTLPILFVYPFFQRYFVKGILVGAIRG